MLALQKGEQVVPLGCRPFHGLSIRSVLIKWADAPGFMPAPAPQAFLWKAVLTAMTLASGTKLGRYEIRSKIGAGGMGEV